MKKILLGIALVLCCTGCLSIAQAAALPEFYVDHLTQDDGSAAANERISWWNVEGTDRFYLFLPGFAQTESLRVHVGEDAYTVDGVTFESHGLTSALMPGGTYTIGLSGREYTLHVLQGEALAALFIQTENGTLEGIHKDKEHAETGYLVLADGFGGVQYDGPLRQLKGRGNSTFHFEKKPYQIKLEDKTDLLNMGRARTWILLANYNDYSLLRNQIAFDLARSVGLPYTPEGRSVDLYIDGEYKGVYFLCEKAEIDEERVAIANLEEATEALNDAPLSDYPAHGKRSYVKDTQKGFEIPRDPEDITGGYLIELEYSARYGIEASGFVTQKGLPVVIKEPEYASQAQVSYIHALVQSLDDALRAPDGIDPQTGKHYFDIIDADSFVRKYVLEEFVKNNDGNKSSQFFFKPADGQSEKLYAGPVWDFDSSFGNYGAEHNQNFYKPTKLVIGMDQSKAYYIYPAAYAQEEFYGLVVDAWFELFEPAVGVLLGKEEARGGLRSIESYAQEIAASAEMNRARWPIYKRGSHPVDTGETLEENVSFLTDFISGRAAFLRETWGTDAAGGLP